MEVGGGNFIACLSVGRSVGRRDGEPVAKIEYVRRSKASHWTREHEACGQKRNVATLPKCLFARLSDRPGKHAQFAQE